MEIKKLGNNGFFWNVLGGGLNAGQASFLLILISRKYDLSTAGLVTIAYAFAVFFQGIGKYGIRNFQVTDMREEYGFGDYLKSRKISVGCALIGAGFFLFWKYIDGSYGLEKAILIFEVVVLKMIDAYEDVYLGRLQQLDQFCRGARIMAVRLLATTCTLAATAYMGIKIHLVFLTGIIVSGFFDLEAFRFTKGWARSACKGNTVGIMLSCIPLCIGTTLMVYVGNIPKYMIDACLSEEIQAIFGYLMLPVFAVTLLNQFIYQPFVKTLGMKWDSGNRKKFYGTIAGQCAAVLMIAIAALIGGVGVGLPVLSGLYAVNLSEYWKEFMVLLAGGSLYAIGYYLNIPLTIMRKQKQIAVGYGMAAVICFIIGKDFVLVRGMMGAAILYVTVNGSLVILYAFLILNSWRKEKVL